jgi:hypothetical protein
VNAVQLGEGALTLRMSVSRRGCMSRRGRVSVCDCVSVRRSYRMTVRRTDSVHLVPTGVVAVVSAAMMRATVTAGETKERHCSHAGSSENHTENV